MPALDRCLNVYDLRAAAKRRLPRAVFEFVDRGSEDGIAVANNRARSSASSCGIGPWLMCRAAA